MSMLCSCSKPVAPWQRFGRSARRGKTPCEASQPNRQTSCAVVAICCFGAECLLTEGWVEEAVELLEFAASGLAAQFGVDSYWAAHAQEQLEMAREWIEQSNESELQNSIPSRTIESEVESESESEQEPEQVQEPEPEPEPETE